MRGVEFEPKNSCEAIINPATSSYTMNNIVSRFLSMFFNFLMPIPLKGGNFSSTSQNFFEPLFVPFFSDTHLR